MTQAFLKKKKNLEIQDFIIMKFHKRQQQEANVEAVG